MQTTTSHSEPTYRERIDAEMARQPKACPRCADDSAIYPAFIGDTWQCDACGYAWEAKP